MDKCDCHKVEVDEALFDSLMLHAADSMGSDEKPLFKPEEDIGEGTASQDEKDYRTELLLLLGAFFSRVMDALRTKHPNSYKIQRIENLSKDWIFASDKAIERQLNKIFHSGVKDMNLQLKEIGLAPQLKSLDMTYYTLVQQQKANMQYIGRQITDKLSQQLRIQDLENQFNVNRQAATKPLPNNAFNVARSRADAAGSYGANVAFTSGQRAAASEWQGVIELDWTTMHDKKVCPICNAYEEGNPYPVDKVPIIPHNWCRCRLRVRIKDNNPLGNPLIPLVILNELDREQNQ